MRRTVTIVFCDLKDSTSLAERLDPETLHEVKERYFGAMAAEITRHGGRIEKYIGDAIMAVFGLPVQHEDDALRAVRAVLAMRTALHSVNTQLSSAYGVELTNRTGVNTGEVVGNDDPRADQKLVTGDTVNVAARLEQAAPPNEIYIGEETWRLVRDAVQVAQIQPLEIKGKREHVGAFRLLSAIESESAARRNDMPILGREAELSAIAQMLQEVRDARSTRLVTLIGDAGIGKSRLAQEAIKRAGASTRVVRGRCLAYGDGITFWPLRGIVNEAAGILIEDPPDRAFSKVLSIVGDNDVAQRLASAIGLNRSAFPLQETAWATRMLLRALAAEGEVVTVVDDIHWAEAAFLELLERLLRAEEAAPLLILCTARQDLLEKHADWCQGEHTLRLTLHPLSQEVAAAVVRKVLGQSELPEVVVERIVTAAEGNPLYLEQIVSMLVETRFLELRDGHWILKDERAEIKIPPTIKALLEARIGQLPVEERTTIEAASVVGLQFPVRAVEAMVPERSGAPVEQQLVALMHKQLLTIVPQEDEDITYRFHHHLLRDTIYSGLLKRTRAMLHLEFVCWADRVNAERDRGIEFEEILGYHLEQAHRYLRELGPLDDRAREIGRDASRRLSSAGRRAFARGDLQAAANLLGRALGTLMAGDPARLVLLPEFGEVLLELGRFDEARALVDEALAIADSQHDRRARACAEVVRLLLRQHCGEEVDWQAAVTSLVERTIPALALEGAHGEMAKAWRLVALVQQNGGYLDEAAASIAKVVEHARLAGDGRLVARSALGLALSALYGPTPVPDAIKECEALIAGDLADRQVQNLIRCKIARLRAMNGDIDVARTLGQRAREVLRDLGLGVRAASVSADLALVEMLAGDPAAAERELRPSCQMLEKMGETYFLSTMAAWLARAVRDQGRDDEALEITRLAEKTAAPSDSDAQVEWRCARASIVARKGAHEEAETLVRSALEMAKKMGQPALLATAWSELASVLRIRGSLDQSRQAVEEALKIYAAKGDLMSTQRLQATHANAAAI